MTRNQNLPLRIHKQDFMNSEGIVVPYEDETQILGFFGKYRDLSNFGKGGVSFRGYYFHTSEAAYMSCKTFVGREVEHLATLTTGKEAKEYGRKVTLRKDWEEVKVSEMAQVILAKFMQNPNLKTLLLSTEDKYLEETNWWNDTFWGVCAGIGRNELGKILMEVRNTLRHLENWP